MVPVRSSDYDWCRGEAPAGDQYVGSRALIVHLHALMQEQQNCGGWCVMIVSGYDGFSTDLEGKPSANSGQSDVKISTELPGPCV